MFSTSKNITIKKNKGKEGKKERRRKKQDQERDGSAGVSTCQGVSLTALAHFWNSCKRPARGRRL